MFVLLRQLILFTFELLALPHLHLTIRHSEGQHQGVTVGVVDEQLAYAHAGREHLLHPHPYYVKGDEAFDDIVSEASDLVVIQCKGAFLPIDARYSGKSEPLLAGLNKRFDFNAGAACEQLLRNLEFTFSINVERREIGDLATGDIRNVYPLAIVQEPLLGFWLAAKLLVDEFVMQTEHMLWKLDLKVRPVVFMTIEELETIAAYINAKDFTLAEFLREKLGTDREHKLSVEQFLKRVFLKSRGLSLRRNEFMAATLEKSQERLERPLGVGDVFVSQRGLDTGRAGRYYAVEMARLLRAADGHAGRAPVAEHLSAEIGWISASHVP
ncbi:MAG: hypothetical protein JWL71_4276 [Acidobacteria bacterium]|nr:hypothetical protein [Acidobacteriota bacterium]